jgi:hypothetical protein
MMMASDGVTVVEGPNVGGEPVQDPAVVTYRRCIFLAEFVAALKQIP